MNLNDRTVQANRLDLDADKLLALQLSKQSIQHARLGPAIHTGVDRMPVAKSLRQRTPFAAVLRHKEDGVNHVEVLVRNIAALTRQVRLDPRELFSADFDSMSISNMLVSVNRP
jgi:hypothetical protein